MARSDDPPPTAGQSTPAPFVLGWEEWLSLPDLGLPAIKAKVDTGARTSALHAFLIEPFGPASAPKVRFGIRPIPGRDDIEIYCSAPIVDRRDITSSNGDKELRVVILSRVTVGDRTWPIEVTLTNRESMSYRMLLGRQAIRDDVLVEPSASFRQPKLSYKLYRHLPRQDLVRRALRIAVLTHAPERPFNRRLIAAAEARGHVLEVIGTTEAQIATDGSGHISIIVNGSPLGAYDAVVPRLRVRDGALAVAAVREIENRGAASLNPADGLDRLRVPLAVAQHLQAARIAVRMPIVTPEQSDGVWASGAATTLVRCIVIGGKAAATLEGRRGRMLDVGEKRREPERTLAEAAAGALKLGLATVDIVDGERGPEVVRVSAAPSLGFAEAKTGARLAEAIVTEAERSAKSWVRR